MSGSKCIQYTVSHDGSGIPYEVGYARNDVLLAKIERLRRAIADLVAAHAELEEPPTPAAAIISKRDYGDATPLVAALLANQATYNALAAELERLQRQADRLAALGRLEVLTARLDVLRHRTAAHNEAYPDARLAVPAALPAPGPEASIESIDQTIERAFDMIEGAVADLRHAEALAKKSVADDLDELDRLRAVENEAVRKRREAEVAALETRCDSGIDAAARARVAAAGAAYIEAKGTQSRVSARAAYLERIERENRRHRDAERASALLQSLAGFDGDAARAFRSALEPVEAGTAPLTKQLEGDALRVVAEARRHAASRILTDEFRRLGYRVDGDVTTVFDRGGAIYMQRPELGGGYACRLSVAPDDGKLTFDVVRADGSATPSKGRAAADTSAEKVFCSDFAAAIAGASALGMATDLIEKTDPGDRPVVVDETLAKLLPPGDTSTWATRNRTAVQTPGSS